MQSEIEKRRKKLELARVIYAKEEMELKIMEREADIERIKENIKLQDKKIKELEKDIQ
jgi:hypothetical protein